MNEPTPRTPNGGYTETLSSFRSLLVREKGLPFGSNTRISNYHIHHGYMEQKKEFEKQQIRLDNIELTQNQ